jgi:Mn2+/Fe2+ NRAMP family transporter
MSKLSHYLKILGPGLLFAGAAVGTSHLYWSTKAGAEYGFAFFWAIVLILIFKYPFFEYGTRYTAAKGETLLSGYKRMGKWVLCAYIIVTPITMFTIQAAVTSLTAGLLMFLFEIPAQPAMVSGIVLAVCLGILYVGKFSVLDNIIKYIIILLTISTFIAVILALGKADFSVINFKQSFPINDTVMLGFLISLMGWMPAPVDMSVWNSIWAESKQKSTKEDFNYKASLIDFNVGYWSTLLLAIFFLSLGALVMYGSGVTFEKSGVDFSKQLFELYGKAFGGESIWAFWLIGIAALTTMISTTLTCLDALPRVMARASVLINTSLPDINHMGSKTTLDDIKSADFDEKAFEEKDRKAYWIWMAILIIGSMAILIFFSNKMGNLLKIATILSFLTTPFYAIANYLLITSKHTPEFARPGIKMRVLSWLGIIFLTSFSLLYIYHEFL